MTRAEEAVLLYAPEQYWGLSQNVKKQLVNGCGTAGWKGKLIPDTIWGLNIKPSCNIHDFMYGVGETIEDKDEADRSFRNNMLRQIETAGGPKWLQWLRRRRAQKYYLAVAELGGPAFWKDKNPETHYGQAAAAAV